MLQCTMAVGLPVGVVTMSISGYTRESGFSSTTIAKVDVPGGHIARAHRDGVRRRHARARVAFRGRHQCAGLERAGRVKQLCAFRRHHARVLARA